MKKELIKTDNYLLVVDDSEIKKGDWFYVITKNIYGGNIISQSTGNGEFAWSEHILSKDTDEKGYHPSHCKKATAHLPLNDSPMLEGVLLLPPLEQEDDVEKLAEEEYPIIPNTSPNVNWDRANKQEGFVEGYNKAKEKYKFTEEDVRKALWELGDVLFNNNQNGIEENEPEEYFDGIIQDLSQPKTPTYFEFEMEDGFSKNNDEYIDELGAKGNYHTHLKIIKTTTNSQGQQVACGKYIY